MASFACSTARNFSALNSSGSERAIITMLSEPKVCSVSRNSRHAAVPRSIMLSTEIMTRRSPMRLAASRVMISRTARKAQG
jgi:hypothetical protein